VRSELLQNSSNKIADACPVFRNTNLGMLVQLCRLIRLMSGTEGRTQSEAVMRIAELRLHMTLADTADLFLSSC
jgi:hypothetical protein